MASTPRTADFGARLREARERRGLSLRAIADRTKISARSLEALERNDIGKLPGGIFSRAFVRAYAAQIGLDPEETIAEFMASFPDDSVTQGHPRTRARSILEELEADSRKTRWPAMGWLALAGVVVAVLITYTFLALYRSKPEVSPSRPAATQSMPPSARSSGSGDERARRSQDRTLPELQVRGPWWSATGVSARTIAAVWHPRDAARVQSSPRR